MKGPLTKTEWWILAAMAVAIAASFLVNACAGTQRLANSTTLGASYGTSELEGARTDRTFDGQDQSVWLSVRPFTFFWPDQVEVVNPYMPPPAPAPKGADVTVNVGDTEKDPPPPDERSYLVEIVAAIGALAAAVAGWLETRRRKRRRAEPVPPP